MLGNVAANGGDAASFRIPRDDGFWMSAVGLLDLQTVSSVPVREDFGEWRFGRVRFLA